MAAKYQDLEKRIVYKGLDSKKDMAVGLVRYLLESRAIEFEPTKSNETEEEWEDFLFRDHNKDACIFVDYVSQAEIIKHFRHVNIGVPERIKLRKIEQLKTEPDLIHIMPYEDEYWISRMNIPKELGPVSLDFRCGQSAKFMYKGCKVGLYPEGRPSKLTKALKPY
ncbi:hypothetical protein KAR91_39285 [Candidatus Pacearchaeota archaeon]|nr:hypothetical protein [Candidatus Pacearchaeota archaeon]